MGKQYRHEQKTQSRIPPLRLAFLGTTLLAGFSLIPWISANLRLAASFWGAAGGLLLLLLYVRRVAGRAGRVLQYEFAPRPVHIVQAAMQTSLYVYWGWYWQEVYHYAPLLIAQIVFLYVFDMLVCWLRSDKWIFGLGPLPIVLSVNFFLWFKDDWFYLQFLLIATGVVCKQFITWNRDGRRTHIFNPSAIALAIFSAGLLLTGSTHITWGEEVAITLGRPPHMYLAIFLVGLVVQALFSVTLVTLAAAAALYILNLLYTRETGLYHFVDSNIPIAVFLGLHLLVTDPATSPRTNFGKLLFGAMYGAGVFGLYAALTRLGAPTFYDKLLLVPPLNLLAQALDRAGRALSLQLRAARWAGSWSPRQLNYAHMVCWVALFSVMMTTGFVSGRHPGSDPEFWRRACEQRRPSACATWQRTVSLMCQHESAGACFSLGVAASDGHLVPRDPWEADRDFGRACDLGEPYACLNLIRIVESDGQDPLLGACKRGDGESCFILGSLYHAGQGVPRDDAGAVALFRRACERGWWRGCARLAESYRSGQGIASDPAQAIAYFEKACHAGHAPSCFNAGDMYRGMNNGALAQQRRREGCDISIRYGATRAAYFRPGSPIESQNAPAICSQPDL